eukprot:1155283-Pelagomonas_calceolata.AAC.9
MPKFIVCVGCGCEGQCHCPSAIVWVPRRLGRGKLGAKKGVGSQKAEFLRGFEFPLKWVRTRLSAQKAMGFRKAGCATGRVRKSLWVQKAGSARGCQEVAAMLWVQECRGCARSEGDDMYVSSPVSRQIRLCWTLLRRHSTA